MTFRRALACLLVAAVVYIFAEGARLRRFAERQVR